jgi:hypothetical protein
MINSLDEKMIGNERAMYQTAAHINKIILRTLVFLVSLYKIFLRVFEIFVSLSMLKHKAYY